MPKTKTFRVVDGRFHFRCTSCQARRMAAVPPRVRVRSFKCNKCREITRCILNRRIVNREQQLGMALLRTSDGFELEVNLFDISLSGVGFEAQANDMRKFSVGRTVSLKCPWNPRLFARGRYRIKSIQGRRIGAESVLKRG